jgi:iron complex outermembrane receptor protein
LFDSANATATFFANAIDTIKKGIDVVVSHKGNIGNGLTLKTDLSGTISNTRRVGVKSLSILEANGQVNRYYSETSRVYLEEAVPRVKANLTNSLSVAKFDFFFEMYILVQLLTQIQLMHGDGRIDGAIINGQVVETEHPVWGGKE